MADHDEDAPDVDYEGEEEEDVVAADDDGAEALTAANNSKPMGSAGGAGDSATDTSDADLGPHPDPPAVEKAGRHNGGKEGAVAGDGEAGSEGEEGEIAAAGSRRMGGAVSKMDRALDAPREREDAIPPPPPPQPRRERRDGNNYNDDNRRRRGRQDVFGNESSGGGSRWGSARRDDCGGGEEERSVYIPPAKRRLLEEQRKAEQEAEAAASAEKEDGEGKSYADREAPKKEVTPIHIQRQTWENLLKSINGTINRLSPSTIKPLIHSLFTDANLIRGRGVLSRSILKATLASPQFTPAYASLMAVVNTKLPECGELLLTRAILEFRRGYKRRDRNAVSSILALLGHLFNQGMAHELLSLQILTVLLDGAEPTEDSVDVAVGYMCVVGRQLTEVSPAGVHAVMERFRGLLHEGSVGRRAQYRIETLLKIKKGGFRDYPTIPDEEQLDLVEREEQITFELGLDDEGLDGEEGLDSFGYDAEYDEREGEWRDVRSEILGEDSSDGSDESGSGSESESEEEEDEVPDQALPDASGDKKKTVVIEDLTETDLVHLRRTIYLTIMSSATFEECTHKLARMDIPPGRECELINMIIECCSQERTFLRYYGLVSGRFCLLHERWQDAFESAFATQYNTIHRLETNKLRNVAKLFGHLLHTDSISWSVLSCIHLNEDETTSSSRIFIKILVQEMAEAMGMVRLKQRFDTDNADPDGPVGGEDAGDAVALPVGRQQQDGSSREWFKGMFPKDNARNTRYAINFFTSIGLGPLTDGMREFLKNAPKLILAQAQAAAAAKEAARQKDDDESSVLSTSSSDTSSFDSSSSGRSGSSSSMSSSSASYTSSSSYSSYSSDSRKRSRGGKRGRDRKRGGRRRSRSYSSSSSSGSDSRGGGRRGKKYSSKDKRQRSDDGASSNAGATPDTGSKRRSVSESPRPRAGKDGRSSRRRRSRSYSSSRSRSPPRGGSDRRSRSSRSNDKSPPRPSSPGRKSPPRDGVDKKDRDGRRKRARSYSSASSRSRSCSPPPAKKESKRSRK